MAQISGNVVALFPKTWDKTPNALQTSTLTDKVSLSSTKLLALVDAPDNDIQGSIFHFTYPVEDTTELLEVINTLKWKGVKDITVRVKDGTIINDYPEYALWKSTFIFSEEAFPYIAFLLASIKKTDEPEAVGEIVFWPNEEVSIARQA